jgi:uncharacterized protein YgbK (DUF1537 family)
MRAAGASQIFFKYCSTFDSTDWGNIGPVAEALMQELGETRTIACPAFPATGRTVYQGHLFVGSRLLSESGMQDHPLTPMRDPDLVRVLGRQTRARVSLIPWSIVAAGDEEIEAALEKTDGMAIVDALTEGDLRAIGRAARGLRLVTGGSGVAMGLPANFGAVPGQGAAAWSPATLTPGREVVLAGSCSGATREQIACALAAGMPALRADPLEIAAGRLRPADAVAFARAAGPALPPLIYSSAGPEDVARARDTLGREAAGDLTERFFGAVAEGLAEAGFTRFLIAGGETSGAVTAALGVKALDVGPKVAPGVPWMLARGTRRENLGVVLKSGNFGAPDIFLSAWSLLQ